MPKTTPEEFMDGIRRTVAETIAQAMQAQQQRQGAQFVAMHQDGQKYSRVVVNRRLDDGSVVPQETTVPQLLAELNDNVLDLIDVTRRRKR